MPIIQYIYTLIYLRKVELDTNYHFDIKNWLKVPLDDDF
jgi:hypothetical protein